MSIEQEIANICNAYMDSVDEGVLKAAKSGGKKAVKLLKDKSPKKTGKYAKGWKTKDVKEGKKKVGVVVHNTEYQLTHLLENGHAKMNGGRVAGKPHIKPVEVEINKEFEKDVISIVQNAGHL